MQKITGYLCKIVKHASKLAKTSFNIYDKDEQGDLVTDIDRKIEKFLVAKLNKKYPNFQIVSEEYNSENNLTENCFIIDPIDGTKNFAAGLPLWGIQIAGVKQGKTVTSVLFFPCLNEMFYADKDGAFMNKQKLEINDAIRAKRPIYDIEGGDKFPALTKLEKEVNRDFRYIACASMGFAWTAAGRFSAFMLRKDHKWDFMPGMYLVEMAGGLVVDESGAHIASTSKYMLDMLSKHARM